MQPRGLLAARPFCPWDSPGKNTRVGSHALLQGIFLSKGLNLHCRWILYCLSHQASPCKCRVLFSSKNLQPGTVFQMQETRLLFEKEEEGKRKKQSLFQTLTSLPLETPSRKGAILPHRRDCAGKRWRHVSFLITVPHSSAKSFGK